LFKHFANAANSLAGAGFVFNQTEAYIFIAVKEIAQMYQDRRDVLCDGLNSIGWAVTPPKATMFVWAKIPEFYQAMGSLEFTKKLIAVAKVGVSPGIGFGEYSVPMR
jgi:aspartate/methionine/tyrosine aminotransferase